MASAKCGWCTVKSYMKPLTPILLQRSGATFINTAAFECANCKRLSVAVAGAPAGISSESYFDSSGTKWFPDRPEGKNFPDVPEKIASAADETHRCFSIGAQRAAVGMARSVIEATAKNVGITSGGIKDKIDALKDQGLIRASLANSAHSVRWAGNDVMHGDIDVEPISAEDAADCLSIMDMVLREVFQDPATQQRIDDNRATRRAGDQA